MIRIAKAKKILFTNADGPNTMRMTKTSAWPTLIPIQTMEIIQEQGPTGRCFQLRDGSGSGIGKNFGFGFRYGSGSGIGTAFLSIGYYRVLKILIGYFSITSLIRYFLLVQLRSSQSFWGYNIWVQPMCW